MKKWVNMSPELGGFDERILLDQLENLAHQFSIPVRYESMESEETFFAGGLCRIKGKYVIIINRRATRREKICILARALKRFDLSQVYLKPALREFLDGINTKAD
jgi:hypothetical protein